MTTRRTFLTGLAATPVALAVPAALATPHDPVIALSEHWLALDATNHSHPLTDAELDAIHGAMLGNG